MKFIRELLPVYGPLAVLAVLSFLLAPPKRAASDGYAIVILDARYSQAQPDGMLRFRVDKMEQVRPGEASLSRVRIGKDSRDDGGISLEGASGRALQGEEGLRLDIDDVTGFIRTGDQMLTLRADSASYDIAGDALSGQKAKISGDGGSIRGDRFVWNAELGFQLTGGVESVYQRR